MAEYRKLKDRDTWHFCRNCTNYPTRNGAYDSRATRPASGELCNQCQAKHRENRCR